MEPTEARLRDYLLAEFTSEQRRALLNVLTSDDETRAAKIGELYQKGGAIAELLMDLEDDPATRTTVVGMLRVME